MGMKTYIQKSYVGNKKRKQKEGRIGATTNKGYLFLVFIPVKFVFWFGGSDSPNPELKKTRRPTLKSKTLLSTG